MVANLLREILVCPSCSHDLTSKSGQLYCVKCYIKFPALNGIPWLFAAPEAAMLDWQQRAQYQLQSMMSEIKEVEASSMQAKSKLTRKRLEKVAQGLHHNLTVLAELLKPLAIQGKATKAVSDAVKSQLPLTQKLMGYYTNLHRDWCWGDGEQSATHEFVKGLNRSSKWGRVLVLGAGSGRYAYDLSLSGLAEAVVALDINPLLMLFGQRVASGQTIRLNEFPIAPKSINEVVVLGECKAPQAASDSLIWLFGDGMNPPFKSASFDTVVTPWFIDVIPQDLAALSASINRILKPGGQWVNFGPYGFLNASWPGQYSAEEVIEIVNGQGFRGAHSEQTRVPYLQSPYSGQNRFETILGFCAHKEKDVIAPAPYRHYPNWLLNLSLPIETNERLSRYGFATQLQSEVLLQIDGKKSIQSMAVTFAQKYQLEPHQAEAALLTLLRQLWDQGSAG